MNQAMQYYTPPGQPVAMLPRIPGAGGSASAAADAATLR